VGTLAGWFSDNNGMGGQTVMTAAEARQQFAALLDRVVAGETVLISRRGKPVVRLSALAPPAQTQAQAALWLQRLRAWHGRP